MCLSIAWAARHSCNGSELCEGRAEALPKQPNKINQSTYLFIYYLFCFIYLCVGRAVPVAHSELFIYSLFAYSSMWAIYLLTIHLLNADSLFTDTVIYLPLYIFIHLFIYLLPRSVSQQFWRGAPRFAFSSLSLHRLSPHMRPPPASTQISKQP